MIFRVLSTAFGVLMVAATGGESQHGPAFVAALLALGAAAVGTTHRRGGDAGGGARRRGRRVDWSLANTRRSVRARCNPGIWCCGTRLETWDSPALPTLVAALGFTVVGLAATSFPLQLPWLPLLAPLAVPGVHPGHPAVSGHQRLAARIRPRLRLHKKGYNTCRHHFEHPTGREDPRLNLCDFLPVCR